MALQLSDRWIWDFWFAQENKDFHVFYLQASKTLGDSERRHWHASIGHAVSRDLFDWQVLPDAIAANHEPAWDDLATWTGSIIHHDGLWYLFYTGISRQEQGCVQRIGLAISEDLIHWRRHGHDPVIEPNDNSYALLGENGQLDQAWRDPWVFRDPDDGSFHAFITARASSGGEGAGVIAHATSEDLLTWKALPPVTAPMGFGQMEVPQLISAGDTWYLLFCSDIATQDKYRRTGSGTGTYYLKAASPYGPFLSDSLRSLEADHTGSRYAGKIVETNHSLKFLSWESVDTKGNFVGLITDPKAVEVDVNGELKLSVMKQHSHDN